MPRKVAAQQESNSAARHGKKGGNQAPLSNGTITSPVPENNTKAWEGGEGQVTSQRENSTNYSSGFSSETSARVAAGVGRVKGYVAKLKKKASVFFSKAADFEKACKDGVKRGITRGLTRGVTKGLTKSLTKGFGKSRAAKPGKATQQASGANSSGSASQGGTRVEPFHHASADLTLDEAEGIKTAASDEIDKEVQRVMNRNKDKGTVTPVSKKTVAQNAQERSLRNRCRQGGAQACKSPPPIDEESKSQKAQLDQQNWLCWHETVIDVIITYQLYELLQNKWRCQAPRFVDDPADSDDEIVVDMIHNRTIVREERIGDPKYTVGYKTKLVQKILTAVRGDLENCLLVENNFRGFIDIVLAHGNPLFDVDKNVTFIATHADLKDSYQTLIQPSILQVQDDELLEEFRKPELDKAELDQIRIIFDSLLGEIYRGDKRGQTTIPIKELKHHPDYGILDFDSYELGDNPSVGFDVFAAICCDPSQKTLGTLTRVIMQKIRSKLEALQHIVSTHGEMDLEEAITLSEKPLTPTLPQEGHDLYMKIYDQIDWNSDSTELSRLMKLFLCRAFSADGCCSLGLEPRVVGGLSYTEFEGMVIPSTYKQKCRRQAKGHRKGLVGAAEAVMAVQHLHHDSLKPAHSAKDRHVGMHGAADTILAGIKMQHETEAHAVKNLEEKPYVGHAQSLSAPKPPRMRPSRANDEAPACTSASQGSSHGRHQPKQQRPSARPPMEVDEHQKNSGESRQPGARCKSPEVLSPADCKPRAAAKNARSKPAAARCKAPDTDDLPDSEKSKANTASPKKKPNMQGPRDQWAG